MDIEVSSNFERALFWAHDKDGAAIKGLMEDLAQGNGFTISENAMGALRAHYDSGMIDEAGTSAMITRALVETGEVLCPPSAIAVAVAEDELGATPMITSATAHPAKFPDAVEAATGTRPVLPPRMADLFDREERVTRAPNDLKSLQTLIRERISA